MYRYDSEEERLLERLEALRFRQQQKKHAATQMETLRRYRIEKEAAEKVAYTAWHANISANLHSSEQHQDSDRWSQDNDSGWKTLRDEAIVARHEEEWKQLEMKATGKNEKEVRLIHYEDIPWPPFGVDFARYLKALAKVIDNNGTNSLRRAFGQAQLRFHPDKFRHRYGNRFHEKDHDKIMEEVHRVSQGLNEARSNILS